jgi:hypothetical protein
MSEIERNIALPPGADSKKPRQGRSPAFPFIPINKALERAETFRIAEGGRPKHFSPLVSACKAWGIGVKTGLGIQTVAALGHYGLFEFEGSGEQRSARLTDLALRILLDKQPVSSERDGLIRRAALTPRIHTELWQKWPEGLPSDPTVETYLIRDRGFSESGARDLIAQFKETIAVAKLGQPANIAPEQPEGSSERKQTQEIEIGDLVQVEIDGALALEQPVRVRAVQEYEGSPWVFIEGSETGIPMEQVVLEQKSKRDSKPLTIPPRLPEEKLPLAQPGRRQEIFALDEGDVILSYPENMSAASFYDLQGYFNLFLRKAQRRAGAGEFFAEVYAPDGLKAKEVRYFDDFSAMMKFIDEFKGKASNDTLRVHLPARATDHQRQSVLAVGAQFA